MNERISLSRRRLLRRLALGASVAPVAAGALRTALAASAPLLSVDAPEAKAVKYVENAKDAKGAGAGNNCANCALYQGPDGSTQGPCQLFPGKEVKAAGWCSSWAPQM
jgi:High potential iron-sulfur protein